jgi:diguanylate cyclase (GGDEF)-like protein
MMSFRTRLTSFFVLIVVVPMAAFGLLMFRLIDRSESGKAIARASAVANTARNMYVAASTQASLRAGTVAGDLALTAPAKLDARAGVLARQIGLDRVTVKVGNAREVDVGDRAAIAPGVALVRAARSRPARTVVASQVTAGEFARQLAGSGIDVVVRSGNTTLASTLPGTAGRTLPRGHGSITIGATAYEAVTATFAGFDGSQVAVTILSDAHDPGGAVGVDRVQAGVLIAGFLSLAFLFTLLASRALDNQIGRFLDAARRLAGGDFSSAVPTSGRDEFALLGEEFNNMSRQLERRLAELEQERARVRQSIRRIGDAFASGLDREALLQLALQTAMDAAEADRGRVSARHHADDPLTETVRLGRLAGLEGTIYEAERRALASDGVGEASLGDAHLATVALGPLGPGGPTHGLITVCRDGRPFTEDDLELLRSLASQATLAMANVTLHFDVQRQAITDDLTGLASHGHFQDLLGAEMDEVRRYGYPVGLIMLDIDNFKAVNDVYGHQQGDLVLRCVANALRKTSRDVDVAARYGGEEMALILPHTDLEGAFEIGERARMAIAALEISLLEGEGSLRVTTSVGVASSLDRNKDELIGAADAALYMAKREGKDRTVRAKPDTAYVVGGE